MTLVAVFVIAISEPQQYAEHEIMHRPVKFKIERM